MKRFLTLTFALLTALADPVFAGDVLTVGPTGGFATVSSAVSSASNGDTILVGPGVTSISSIVVNQKSLSIVANQVEAIQVTGLIFVGHLLPGQTVLLAGLDLDSSYTPNFPSQPDCAVWLFLNKGSVRMENCRVTAAALVGVKIDQSDDVALVDCEVSAPGPSDGAAIWANGSFVALHGSVAQGPMGETPLQLFDLDGKPGGEALAITTSLVQASGCTFIGGVGGTGGACSLGSTGDGGPGGIGVEVFSGTFRYRDCALVGGAGGQPGASLPASCPDGSVGITGLALLTTSFTLAMPGVHRALNAPVPMRELVPFPITLSGEPGELAGFILSTATAYANVTPQSFPLLVSFNASAQLFLVGALPPSGAITMNAAFPDLGIGVESVRLFMQSIHLPAGGFLTFGAPTALVAVDSSF